MAGFLIPPWFKYSGPDKLEMNIASAVWGISLTVALFSATKAGRQSWRVWRRTERTNTYIVLVWIEWVSSVVMSVVTWFFLYGTIPSSFPFFFVIVTLWSLQVQCIIQIIINRISLLTRNQRKVNYLKWGTALLLTCINISVYTIWIPARLQISQSYIHLNEIWDRAEKGIFLVVDAGLNIYFVYLVRSRLIANGLEKYYRLYRFNLAMIVFSTSLDAVLIGVMSLANGFIYLQFHPFVYLFKLHIELNITQLLSKIVVGIEEGDSNPSASNGGTGRKTFLDGSSAGTRGIRMATLITANREFTELRDNDLPPNGIQKTVETEIRYTKGDDDDGSQSSSTRELNVFEQA
ncbi:hypothetical protein F5Y08DRAFT_336939 [Xylaria arbuscula]|uniref:Uncharacterized protein n=1 Tax=Xylaria arbuscula TaxID=114810 RepID=A0A9W8NAU3_9PEZI|nr:hypothetical protein F5Y08DRAFT_336939 [Xylaria arbuscula]KAJ3566304.1 hypothetical protein NPX13_g7180 [Xylaria arbuscula]